MSRAPAWTRLPAHLLPFADAASATLPLARLLRLSLFQVSVGLSAVLLIGTLNRVMIVELGVPASLVAAMVSLPLLLAPLRALVGFRSDRHRSLLGWRRVPYLWFGTLLQFGGFAIMPFALLILAGDTHGPVWIGQAAAAAAFLMVGAGLHTVQTVGLALATDLSPPEAQPRVVAALSVMLLVGMLLASLGFGALLADFSAFRLIQVIQGAAVLIFVLNAVALWKQEPRDPARTRAVAAAQPGFRDSWRALRRAGDARWGRRLTALGLGSAAFSMQDILLEPYGGQVLGLGVGATTLLTALFALGGIAGFLLAGRAGARGADPQRLAAWGALAGLAAFAAVIVAAPAGSAALFALGAALIGLGSGLFGAGQLTACMQAIPRGPAGAAHTGLVLGAWGAVQASAAGGATAFGGALRDGIASLAASGRLGPALDAPATGYAAVYAIEIALLFATLAAIGPLVRTAIPLTPAPLGATR